jgi:hypothetical protein
MITYAAINLTTKKMQIGSTVCFENRYKQHLVEDMNPEFNRALQKDPENFFWLISEDDGLDTREEEQFYLDFYCGSPWCYNLNPYAVQPPSTKGTIWWNNGEQQVKQTDCPGEWWVKGRLDSWWTNGEKNTISMECPGEGWRLGRVVTPDHARKMSESGSGNLWWNNGIEETRAKECPGEGWVPGRTTSAEGRVSWTNGVSNTFSKECPGEGWYRGITLTEEKRVRRGDANRGKKYGKRNPSVGKKISEKNKGRKLSEEHKKSLAEARSKIPVQIYEICGKEIRNGMGNLKQHLRTHY